MKEQGITSPLISVIVPVYKVEAYLEECVASIRNQTYCHLEIILVDDGSPDSCPDLCDRFAAADARIRVIHKPNGGISSARNAGLREATGDFIGFVDSDDFIAPEMYEQLLRGFDHRPNLGIVSCLVEQVEGERRSPFVEEWAITAPRLIKAQDFAADKLEERSCHAVWNKLYRADLAKAVAFREGKLAEDTFYLFDLSKVLVERGCDELILPEYLYCYRMREDSFCHIPTRPILLHVVDTLYRLYQEAREEGSPHVALLYQTYVRKLFVLMAEVMAHRTLSDLYFERCVSQLKRVSPLYVFRRFGQEGKWKYFLMLRLFPYWMRRRMYGF